MPRHAKHHHQRRAKQRATGRNIIVTWYWMIFIDRIEFSKYCHIPSIECVSKIQSILSIICHAVCIQHCHCLELGNETVICNLCHSSFLFVVYVRIFVSSHVSPYPKKSQLIINELSRVWLEKVLPEIMLTYHFVHNKTSIVLYIRYPYLSPVKWLSPACSQSLYREAH